MHERRGAHRSRIDCSTGCPKGTARACWRSASKSGTGESVWLGFFLCSVLGEFAALARLQGDAPFAERCATERAELRRNLEQHGWDGGWYRRAYFDDGSALGSATNPECRIDSIAQSWSVLSGAGDPECAHTAMQAVDERLVRRDHALIQLLDPPFDQSDLDPGYIRGYVPGVRENGGQYTHGAAQVDGSVPLVDDRREHTVVVIHPAGSVRHRTDAQRALA